MNNEIVHMYCRNIARKVLIMEKYCEDIAFSPIQISVPNDRNLVML